MNRSNRYPQVTKEVLLQHRAEGLTHKQIGEIYGCGRHTIIKKCRKFGIIFVKKFKYVVNNEFFDTWSYPMAYVLGFLMADGCVNKYKNYNKYRLSIQLQLRDIEILEYIRDKLSPTRPIQKDIKRKNKNGTISKVCCIQINLTGHLKERLFQLGIVPRKSGKEQIPIEIPEEFKWSFICGYFDGDGCIRNRKKEGTDLSGHDWSVCSVSSKIIKQIKAFIGFGKIRVTHKNKTKGRYINLYKIDVRDKPSIIYIRNKMYENIEFCLQRKLNIMREVNVSKFSKVF